MNGIFRTSLLCVFLFTAGLTVSFAVEPPEVLKVEPPDWWAQHSLNPVRLLVRGQHLTGATVSTESPELEIRNVRVNRRGSYLFLDVWIDPNAPPNKYDLRVQTSGGTTSIEYSILPRLDNHRPSGFSSDDVLYLLMPDRFANGDPSNDDPVEASGLYDRSKDRFYHGGDFQGVINQLDYLEDLGITALWMNPIYENADRLNEVEQYGLGPITDYHGYGAVDFYDVDEHLGSLELLKKLVSEAGSRGIRVIQDQVANHTGPYHPWVDDPPTDSWYNGSRKKHHDNTWQVWTLIDPYSTPEVQRPTLEGWFAGILPDLNQNDPETARYLIQNAIWWVGTVGFAGIRQDTLPYVSRSFWKEWREALDDQFPDLNVVGEMWDGNPSWLAFFQGGESRYDGIDSRIESLFDFPLYYGIRSVFAGSGAIRELAQVLSHDYLYVDPHRLVTFLGSHDVPRFMNEPGASLKSLKLAYTFLLTSRGIPLVYYGDEIGMKGGADPDNRRDFPGGWAEDDRNAFEMSGRTPEEESLRKHLKDLIRIRKESISLKQGQTINLLVDETRYAYARATEVELTLVAFNQAQQEQSFTFDLPAFQLADQRGSSLISPALTARIQNNQFNVLMPARSAAIFRFQLQDPRQ